MIRCNGIIQHFTRMDSALRLWDTNEEWEYTREKRTFAACRVLALPTEWRPGDESTDASPRPVSLQRATRVILARPTGMPDLPTR